MYCIIVQAPTNNHPNKDHPTIISQIGQKLSKRYYDINEAYRDAEKQYIASGKSWFYTVIECEK